MGERAFKVVQFGKENPAAHGTGVAATTKFLGECNLPKDRNPVYPAYNLGARARSHKGFIYQTLVDGMTLSLEDSYYQALVALLSMTLKGGVTPTIPEGSARLWTFLPSLTGSNALDSLTVEVADERQAYEVAYVMGKRITLSGAMGQNQAVKVSVDCFGDAIEKTTLTPALTIPAITPIIANNTKFYVNDTWATLGNTQKTGLIRDWSLEIIGGAHPVFHGNGKKFNAHGETYIDFLLRLTLEDDADAGTLFFDGFQGSVDQQIPRALRISIPGPIIFGTTPHSLVIDLWGAPEEANPMGQETDGDHLMPVVFHSLYDTTGAALLNVKLTTDVATL